MFDRLVETFCEFDDFCKSVQPQWEATLVTDGGTSDRKHGPEGGLCDSEIMTRRVLYHGSRFKNFKTFYNGIVLGMLRPYFRRAPCYGRFITLTKRVWALLAFFLASRMGRKRIRVCAPFTGVQARLNGRVGAGVVGRVEGRPMEISIGAGRDQAVEWAGGRVAGGREDGHWPLRRATV